MATPGEFLKQGSIGRIRTLVPCAESRGACMPIDIMHKNSVASRYPSVRGLRYVQNVIRARWKSGQGRVKAIAVELCSKLFECRGPARVSWVAAESGIALPKAHELVVLQHHQVVYSPFSAFPYHPPAFSVQPHHTESTLYQRHDIEIFFWLNPPRMPSGDPSKDIISVDGIVNHKKPLHLRSRAQTICFKVSQPHCNGRGRETASCDRCRDTCPHVAWEV